MARDEPGSGHVDTHEPAGRQAWPRPGSQCAVVAKNTEWAAYTLKTGTKWVRKPGSNSIPNCCQYTWRGLQGILGREEISAKTEHAGRNRQEKRPANGKKATRSEGWADRVQASRGQTGARPPPAPVSCGVDYWSVSPTQLQGLKVIWEHSRISGSAD